MINDEKLDVIIYGATGYTGKLVVENFINLYPSLKWGIAGRDMRKLERTCSLLEIPQDKPSFVADSFDTDALTFMAESCKCIITTVGPYQLYGSKLFEVCAETGTDYVDLTGEPNWMFDMIQKHTDAAKASGARLVFSCGFDSIPFDLGVQLLQETAKSRFGSTFETVQTRVTSMNGKFSGGTAASLSATVEASIKDPDLLKHMMNPFILCEGTRGTEQPLGNKPYIDDNLNSWVAPFVMAPINTKTIHRTNYLNGYPYGRRFQYEEMVVTGPGDDGKKNAEAMINSNPLGEDPPKPGEGPTRKEREEGNYEILIRGENKAGESIRVNVHGNMDPGYGSTSKMITEAALCLVEDCPHLSGGIHTPASAMNQKLIKRLIEKAGLSFAILD